MNPISGPAAPPSPERSFASGRPGRAIAAAHRYSVQWLARPFASLHLLLAVFGLLAVLGPVMVLSASNVASLTQGGSSYGVFAKHLAYSAAGLVLFALGLRVPLRCWRAASPLLLLACVVLLAVVLVPGLGTQIRGAQKWFIVGGLSFQPAEPAKITLALWGAHVLTARRKVIHRWRYALNPLVPVAGLLLTLVVLQPDLGTAVSLGIVVVALLYFAHAPARLLTALVGGGLLGVIVLGLTAAYRSSRLASFLAPSQDPLGAAYQSTQALYALADGGVFGVGLGQGRAKWDYLPNAYNDFIFAIIGEELGLIGGLLLLGLFAVLTATGLRIAARCADPWTATLTSTLTAWLVAQAAINIGYVVGLLPVTGIPLPMISSGGTSLVCTMFGFGLLANAALHEPEATAALQGRDAHRLAWLLDPHR